MASTGTFGKSPPKKPKEEEEEKHTKKGRKGRREHGEIMQQHTRNASNFES
jgi:hypothetical protein